MSFKYNEKPLATKYGEDDNLDDMILKFRSDN